MSSFSEFKPATKRPPSTPESINVCNLMTGETKTFSKEEIEEMRKEGEKEFKKVKEAAEKERIKNGYPCRCGKSTRGHHFC